MTEADSQYIDALWGKWLRDKDDFAANELISNYMYLVNYHVERVASHIPANFDKNELNSFGLLGLYDALNKFDPTRELKFDTYATIRVRGAIMDGLRKEDWLPRKLRDQSKQINKITRQLEQDLQRSPTSAEIGMMMELEADEVETIINSTIYANVISIDTHINASKREDETTLSQLLVDDDGISPEEHVMQMEIVDHLVANIMKLNKNEQLVISLFYDEGLTLTEIGEILALTTSRISQIHKRAIFKLRELLVQL